MALKVIFEGKEMDFSTDEVDDTQELKTFVKGEDGKYKSNGTARFVSWRYMKVNNGKSWLALFIDESSYLRWFAYAESYDVPTISESEICTGREGVYVTTHTFTKPVLKKK